MFGAPDTNGPKQSQDWNPFYKYGATLMTNAFADTRKFDWALVYGSTAANRRFGIEFKDLICQSNKDEPAKTPCIVPYLELSDEELRMFDAVLLDFEPIPSLRLPPNDYICAAQQKYDTALHNLTRHSTTRLRGTPLHPRHTYITTRAVDVTDATIAAFAEIANKAAITSFSHKWWNISAAIDGSSDHNVILDVYLEF